MLRPEQILKKIPEFKKLKMDQILFEGPYPVLFTCTVGDEVYLFNCCEVSASKIQWIATKTNYSTLIKLLTDKITIRDAFLAVTEDKYVIECSKGRVDCEKKRLDAIPTEILPTEGEYMEVEDDEFAEEIAQFKQREGCLWIIPQIDRDYYNITRRSWKIPVPSLVNMFANTEVANLFKESRQIMRIMR